MKNTLHERESISLYLNEIGKHKVLTEEEQKDLFLQIEKNPKAKEELITKNLRLVVSVARNFIGKTLSFLDLIQEGNIGLMRAIEKFDPEKGKFSPFAVSWIRQKIMRALYEQDRTIRIPVSKEEKIRKAQKFIDSQDQKPSVEEIAEHIGLSPSEAERTLQMSETIFSLDTPLENGTPQGNFIPDSKTKTPEEILIQQEKTQEIHTIIQERLSETRKKVICFHYGIGHGIILSNKGKAQVLRKKETQIMGILATSKKVLASAFWRYNKRESL